MIILKLLLFAAAHVQAQVSIRFSPITRNPIVGEQCPGDLIINCTTESEREPGLTHGWFINYFTGNDATETLVEHSYDYELAGNYSYYPLVLGSAAKYKCLQVIVTSAVASDDSLVVKSTLFTDFSTLLRLDVIDLTCIVSRSGSIQGSTLAFQYTVRGRQIPRAYV